MDILRGNEGNSKAMPFPVPFKLLAEPHHKILNFARHETKKAKRGINVRNKSTPKSAIASVAAVEQYIALRCENCSRHRANILVCISGKNCCSGVRVVSVKASEGIAEIVIEDLHTIYGGCSNRFTIDDSSFCLICKTLQIMSMDTLGCPITIEITGA